MQEFLSAFEYKRELTADGSPTLRLPPTWEPMHALDGAFSETLYIYQPTVHQALSCLPTPGTGGGSLIAKTPRLLSLGLGLGYNEILIACEALHLNLLEVFVDSYESVSPLRFNFENWILGVSCELQDIYDNILQLYANHYRIEPKRIREFLKEQLQKQNLQLLAAITAQSHFQQSVGILFDAFSDKTSPELWTEEFLDRFLKMAAADRCFLSTYASKGTLHRALKNNNFTSEKKAGFGKKRESTFAFRNPPQ